MKRDLLSVSDLSREEIEQLIEQALAIKPKPPSHLLSGKVLALIFEKPSLRTRVSFDVAMHQLGGHAIYLPPDEVGLGKRERVSDVARTLSRYVDGIAARTFSHNTLHTLAEHSSIPVINALSDLEHPCQALSDLLTIYEKKGKLSGLTLAFIGDGNNVANSLFLAASLVGMNFYIASPPGYEIKPEILKQGKKLAASSASQIKLTKKPAEVVKGADIVYTDVWTSMGQESEAEKRRLAFSTYKVDNKLLDLAKGNALFMHPLPAHQGEEISTELLDDPRSVVFDQAENRLHLQKALLVQMLP
ncbi:MAG: ornithine carbamoyltransferase [Chloroflexi bacterium CG08_land_8_20_14_0_20_45_12]|nr:MAG: ornithine carbamoyltransferase [Dehalococcoidia bacterium CG2_30_46_9]PIU22851.1 MAG: ornithine carbamoyltransferase [Chloroflexi bacterium CG08_land_8_20_14_0_20_45_12]